MLAKLKWQNGMTVSNNEASLEWTLYCSVASSALLSRLSSFGSVNRVRLTTLRGENSRQSESDENGEVKVKEGEQRVLVLFVLFVAQTMSVSSTAIMVFAGVMDSQPEPEEAVFVLGCKVSAIQDIIISTIQVCPSGVKIDNYKDDLLRNYMVSLAGEHTELLSALITTYLWPHHSLGNSIGMIANLDCQWSLPGANKSPQFSTTCDHKSECECRMKV